jgi:hypothetical protein
MTVAAQAAPAPRGQGGSRKSKRERIVELAEKCLADADGNALDATALMEEIVSDDASLFRELMMPLLRTACYDAVGSVIRSTRSQIWNAPNHDPGGRGARVHALAAGNRLMMFQLPGGRYLGEATRAEVLVAATFYDRQAKDMTMKGRWLELVAKKMKDEHTPVAKCLTEDALAELRKKVGDA